MFLTEQLCQQFLVECLFADSDDAEAYNAEVIAKAIVCGLVGADGSNYGEWKLGWNQSEVGWWYSTDPVNKYYFTSANGWKEIDGEWYIFDDNGYDLQDSWYYDENEKAWYYLDDECKMVRGSKDKLLRKCIDSVCYAFDEHGKMYCDCVTPDGFKVDGNGNYLEN